MSQWPEVPTVEAMIEKVTQLTQQGPQYPMRSTHRPLGFDARWDGDSQGWVVYLDAACMLDTDTPTTVWAPELTVLRFGGDLRVFQGAVAPWPEAQVAIELGEALARHFGAPFRFLSPDELIDVCPPWWERARTHPCDDCGKLILRCDPPDLPGEVCYHCHLRREARSGFRATSLRTPPG
jgi:hypothetical protein